MKNVIIFLLVLLLAGCASNPKRIGSKAWHEKRLAEIEEAYEKEEIDKGEYLKLKNEADAIRESHLNPCGSAYPHFGYGHYHRGTSIGVGVGF